MKLLITVAIGETCLAHWREHCERSWNDYALRHGFYRHVVERSLDLTSTRHPAWQKCLIPSASPQFEQVAIIDSDIAINPDAPSIFEGVPIDKIGAVISGGHLQPEQRGVMMGRLEDVNHWEKWPGSFEEFQRAAYAKHGLMPAFGELINTGVLVASPARHAGLFEQVYRTPDRGDRCYEQIPLSHAILSAGFFHPLDARFNSVLYETLLVHHYHLFRSAVGEHVTRSIVRSEFANNYFLHFAYGQSALMRFLPPGG